MTAVCTVKGLGRIQREVLRPAARQGGCTTADLRGASRKDARAALQALAVRGLVGKAGTRKNTSPDGRGKPLRVRVATGQGRQAAGGAP